MAVPKLSPPLLRRRRNPTPMTDSAPDIQVGPCRVEPRELRLTRDGQVIRLEPRVLQVLLCLARHDGRTVSRDQLLAEAWRGQIVSDDAINRAIWKLRAALLGERTDISVIETVPRLGYRLLWPVTTLAPATAAPSPRAEETAPGDAAAVPADPLRAAATPPIAAATHRARHPWRLLAAMLLAAAVTAIGLHYRGNRPTEPVRVRALTNLPWAEYEPSFSPDGRRVVFAADNDNSGSQIWIQSVDSATAQPLVATPGNDHSPVWSPSADRIAFVREIGDTCSVELIAISGGTPRRITGCTAHFWAALSFSPDGRQLVLADRNSAELRPQSLYVVDVESGQRRQITHPTHLHGDFLPRWSPDGSQIAFARSRGRGLYQIMRVAPAGGEASFIHEPLETIKWLSWRDPQRLIYLSMHDGMPALWQWQGGHSTRWLSLTDPDIDAISIAPGGDRAALVRTQRQRSVWRYPNPRQPATSPPDSARVLLTSSREDYDAQYSPDGTRLAFVSTRSGYAAVWLADATGNNPQLLWGDPAGSAIGINWAPDSRRLVFERAHGGVSDLCIVTLAGALNCLAPQGDRREMPAWSPDGEWIYYTVERDTSWSLWRTRVDGTDTTALVDDSAYAAVVSHDGRRLLFARVGLAGLWAFDLKTRQISAVLDDLPAIHPRAYAVAADGIYYLNRDGQIAFRANDAAQSSVLFRPPRVLRPTRLSLHPTSGHLLLTQDENDRGDISLLDNLRAMAPAP